MPATALATGGRQRGFTLLEAIVALTLIALAGAALFSWVNANMISLARVRDVNERSLATENILDLMQKIDPMLSPTGERDLGSYSVRWNVEAVAGPQDGANYPRGLSLYKLALFRNHISVIKGGDIWFEFDLRQVGYQRVRTLRLPTGDPVP